MEKFIPILCRCPLFEGIRAKDLSAILILANAQHMKYKKNQVVFRAGTPAVYLGVVLSGKIQLQHNAACGMRSIIASFSEAEVFGASFACAGIEAMPSDAIAVTDCEILLFSYDRLLSVCTGSNRYHARLISNLLRILARHNLIFSQKLEIVAQRTTREKLLAFFTLQAQQAGSRSFSIAFNRQQLAEYLSVSRCAMTTELTRLKNEGVIAFERNRFELLADPENPRG